MLLFAENSGPYNHKQPAESIKEMVCFSPWISKFELSPTVTILQKGGLNSSLNRLTINYMPLKRKSKEARQKIFDRLPAGIALIWLGMIFGISFLETPIKFRAASVSLEIGLDIGRHVFGAFNKVECALALVMLILAVIIRLRGRWLILLAALWLSLVLQTFWLLPILNARVELIVQGQTPGPSVAHSLYVVLEILKAIALSLYGFGNLLIEKNRD